MRSAHPTGVIALAAGTAVLAAGLLAVPHAQAEVGARPAGHTVQAAPMVASRPTVAVTSTTTVQPSRPVRVKVTGFAAGRPVTVTLGGRALGTLTPPASGTAAAQFTVSRHVKVGTRALVATQAAASAGGTARVARAGVAVHTDWPETFGNGSGAPTTRVENSFTPANVSAWDKAWAAVLPPQDGREDEIVEYGGLAVVNGVIYAGLQFDCGLDCSGGGVASLDAATGALRWVTPMVGDGSLGKVLGAPLVIKDRVWVQDDAGHLWVLDAADGSVVKRIDDVVRNDTPSRYGPLLEDGVVIVGKTHAFDPTTYRELWNVTGNHVAVGNGTVTIVVPLKGTFVTLDVHTGEELWRMSEGSETFAVAGTSLFYCAGRGTALVARNQRTGAEVWRLPAAHPRLDGCYPDVAVTNGVLTTTWTTVDDPTDDHTSTTVAYTGYDPATGKVLWTSPGWGSSQISAGRVILATRADSPEGTMAVLDPINGATVGAFLYVERERIAIADGRIYVPALDEANHATLTAYRPAG